MERRASLAELGRWARSVPLIEEIVDQRPYDALEELYLRDSSDGLVRRLCSRLGASTLLQALEHPRADGLLSTLVGSAGAQSLIGSLGEAFAEQATLDD